MVVTEAISQEFLVDMLDDREESPVGRAESQLRIGMPWRRNVGYAEQAPGQCFAHLGRIVVHRLEIDPGHSSQPIAVPCGIEDYPPRRLRRAQRAVSAVLQRESLCAEQDTSAVRGRNAPVVGRVGLPHVEPRAVDGLHRLGQDTASWLESSDMKHVHVRIEELRLPQRRADVFLDRARGGGGVPGLIEQPQLRGRGWRDLRKQQIVERQVLGLGAQRRAITACYLVGRSRQGSAASGG